jgi:hypothetical protein
MQADPDNFPTSSSDQSIKFDLKNVDLDPLTEKLRNHSTQGFWLYFIQNDGWEDLLTQVLLALTNLLAVTSLKNKVIRPLRWREAKAMVSDFNEEQLKM